eukprot:1157590-Pelagomonas_calceolata.AAC.7
MASNNWRPLVTCTPATPCSAKGVSCMSTGGSLKLQSLPRTLRRRFVHLMHHLQSCTLRKIVLHDLALPWACNSWTLQSLTLEKESAVSPGSALCPLLLLCPPASLS